MRFFHVLYSMVFFSISRAFVLLILTRRTGPRGKRHGVWLQVEIAEQNPSWCAPQPSLLSVAQHPLQPSLFPRSPLVMSKKAPKNNEPETNYAERDIVLAKVRGFPPWPGMVSRVLFLPSIPLLHRFRSYRS